MAKPIISDVSDTALWVAAYRAQESERPDALFKDPLANFLTGERGRRIAAKMSGSKYTKWSVVTRTHIIDQLIRERVANDVDLVINLGAGLDTRPYRLDLPASLLWVEVDYPHMIDFKNEQLAGEAPQCKLERIGLDLANRSARSKLFSDLSAKSRKALILTEGIIIYLDNQQVADLAEDLSLQSHFFYWIAEYHSPQVMKYMKTRKRQKQMQNAPFKFAPDDWFHFFKGRHWKARDIRYLGQESVKLGRTIPMPWWAVILRPFFRSKQHREAGLKFSAYVLLESLSR